ncbi:glycosyltransferase, partial [candidate division KSB1 bacterium]|nr:glycosyltransferase [candidate division KSB1 bacterium]
MQTFGFVLLLIYSIFPILLVWGVVRKKDKHQQINEKKPVFVSIVVAAYNQAERIESFLLDLVNQTFPRDQFEVILVDDQSTDETLTLARRIARRFPGLLQVISSNDSAWKSSKKSALAAGIRAAKGEWFLLTDADTFPPPSWLKGMNDYMLPQTILVSGFSPQT